MKNVFFFLIVVFLAMRGLVASAATADTIDIPSAAMSKTYKAAVVLPASYTKTKADYPVLYLLHGVVAILEIGLHQLAIK